MGLLQVVIFLAFGTFSEWVNSPNCGLRDSGRRNLITNGNIAEQYSFPWQVGLNFVDDLDLEPEYTHVCGGAVLNKDWILTAAHCVSWPTKYEGDDKESWVISDPEDFVVIAGDYNYTDDDTDVRQVIGYEAIIMHEDFTDLNSDIALIKLNRSLELSSNAPWKVNPICLPTTGNKKYGEEILASGWGTYDDEHGEGPEHMHWNSFTLRNDEYCRALAGDVWYNSSTSICFSKYEGNPDSPDARLHDNAEGVCRGDSGGSAIQKHSDGRYYSEGVASKTVFCGNLLSTIIYAETRAFVDWIDDMITKYPNIPESKFARRVNATEEHDDRIDDETNHNDTPFEPEWTGSNCTESQLTNDFSYAYCGGAPRSSCAYPIDTEACAEGFDMCKQAPGDYRCYPADGLGAPRICEQCFLDGSIYYLGECVPTQYQWKDFEELGLAGTVLYADHVDNCTMARANVQKQLDCVKQESKSGCCSDFNCKWSESAQLCYWESLISLEDDCQANQDSSDSSVLSVACLFVLFMWLI